MSEIGEGGAEKVTMAGGDMEKAKVAEGEI